MKKIFNRYVAGLSPRAIAAELNAQNVSGPRGGGWNASTINGNAARGNGVLHNKLYRGTIVWGSQRWTKSRETGARRAQAAKSFGTGDQRCAAPVHRQRGTLGEGSAPARLRGAGSAATLGGQSSTRSLLSGLVRCGSCGAPTVASGAQRRLVWFHRRERGPAVCPEGRSVLAALLEARVVTAVKGLLLDPAVVEEAVREHQALTGKRRRRALGERQGLEKELAEVKRRAIRLVDQVADGELSGAAVKDRLAQVERRRTELEIQLQEGSNDTSRPEIWLLSGIPKERET